MTGGDAHTSRMMPDSRPQHRWRPGLPLAIACGLVDAAANVLLLAGIRLGDLSVMSVLTAMYPAGTILLAAVVLRERIAPVQWVGLALALAAAGMLAVA
jgi:drug/metabolite transporter (DMT)-like permease